MRLDYAGDGGCAIGREDGDSLPGAIAAVDDVLEVCIPLEAFRGQVGQFLELMIHVERGNQRLESLPPGQPLRLALPGPDWDAGNWSA